jgi:hypothetical protein
MMFRYLKRPTYLNFISNADKPAKEISAYMSPITT